ncbi:hypothetical protein EXIGLDRAFT_49515 [Exidia glandulosa HHB12029]|uniref:Zinc-ribbon 15 domain-containing protein n=1 Tax=Exidia glandulosa HHB12029 TaxID=1314781 RepID=A0A165IG35_EXIGL|nr:hypothetical protein EXIGLDRAFT_49515 [Exidia glandulosa HHB12029]
MQASDYVTTRVVGLPGSATVCSLSSIHTQNGLHSHFGCPTIVKPGEDVTPRICPRCNNASVIDAKERMWFELCFVRLFPFHSSRVWHCTICRWQVPHQSNWEPVKPAQGAFYHPPQNAQSPYQSPHAGPPR